MDKQPTSKSLRRSTLKNICEYEFLKDRPLTDYSRKKGWLQTSPLDNSSTEGIQQNANGEHTSRKEAVLAWGSFDVASYCRLGGTVRIGVNGEVRQPKPDDSNPECEDDDPFDRYNQILRVINKKNGTLDVQRKSEIYASDVHVPLCWEDQLSDTQVAVVNCSTCQKTMQGELKDSHENQQEAGCSVNEPDSSTAVSSIEADIVNSRDDPKILLIYLQSDLGSNLNPPLEMWKFDVHLLDKTDSRQSTRVFTSIQPQQRSSHYVLRFDLLEDLQWIHSINQLYGRDFHVTIDGSHPWRFHLRSKVIQVANRQPTEKGQDVDDNESIPSDDEDVVPVSSMPVLWLDKFVGCDSMQLQQEQETRGCSAFADDHTVQLRSPEASTEMRGDKRESDKEVDDIHMSNRQARQLTIEDIISNMMSGVRKHVPNKTLRSIGPKSRGLKPVQTEPVLLIRSKTQQQCQQQCLLQHPQSNTQGGTGKATVVIPPSVESQRRSFLRAQYVCRLHKASSKAKKLANKPPSSEKVRQIIEQANGKKGTGCKLTGANPHKVPVDASQQQNRTLIDQRSRTYLSFMTSHLRSPHRESTAIRQPQTGPFPSTQDAVSLTGLQPASAYRNYRPQTSSGVSSQVRSSGSATKSHSSFPRTTTTYPTAEGEIEITARKISRTKRPYLKQTHNTVLK